MKTAFLLFALSIVGFCQTQGNLPGAIDGTTSHLEGVGCGFNCINTPEDLAVGDLVVIGFTQSDPAACLAGTTPPWTFNSSHGNTFTALTGNSTTINGANNKVWAQLAYSFVTVAGPDQFTVTGGTTNSCIATMVYGRIKHFTGSVDGSLHTCVSPGGAPFDTCSTSNTTTANGDILITLASSNGNAGANYPFNGLHVQAIAQDYSSGNGVNTVLGYINATSIGATSVPMYVQGGNSSEQLLAQTIAFKPDIAVVTTALPDMVSGAAYDATVLCVGGTSTLTYSETGSLPTGITFNTTTGHLSGTPTSTGSFSSDFACTDGTVPSSTKTLTFNSGTAEGTPALVQSTLENGDNGGKSFNLTSTHCGDVILLFPLGMDTGGGAIGVQAFDGVNNYFHINDASPVQRITGIGMNRSGPLSVIAIGPLVSGGTKTISLFNNQNATSALDDMLVAEISNVQGVIDPLAFNQIPNTGSGSISQAYPTVVPNTMLVAATGSNHQFDTNVWSAPFTSISSAGSIYATQFYAYDLVASPSTVTATSTITTTGSVQDFVANVVGLRPRLPISACGEVTTGLVHHRVQIY